MQLTKAMRPNTPLRFFMSSNLSTAPSDNLLVSRQTDSQRARSRPKAPNVAPILSAASRAAYDKDCNLFVRFGGSVPCNLAALNRYIELMRTKLSPMTLHRRLMAVRHAHLAAGHPSPTDDPRMLAVLRWLRSGRMPPKGGAKLAETQPPRAKREGRKAKPLTRALLLRCLDTIHRTMLCRRDEALLLLGFAGALKRGELCAIDVGDVRFTSDEMIVQLKADAASKRPSRSLLIPFVRTELCAATAVQRLIEHLALEPNTPLFRSFNRASEPNAERLAPASVSTILKGRLEAAGINSEGFSGESLRRGRLLETKGELI